MSTVNEAEDDIQCCCSSSETKTWHAIQLDEMASEKISVRHGD